MKVHFTNYSNDDLFHSLYSKYNIVEEFAKLLQIEQLDFDLEIMFVDDIAEGLRSSTGICCYIEPDYYLIEIRDTKYESLGSKAKTLAHEMMHVQQFLKKDLINKIDLETPYLERWYEVEARKAETILSSIYANYILPVIKKDKDDL